LSFVSAVDYVSQLLNFGSTYLFVSFNTVPIRLRTHSFFRDAEGEGEDELDAFQLEADLLFLHDSSAPQHFFSALRRADNDRHHRLHLYVHIFPPYQQRLTRDSRGSNSDTRPPLSSIWLSILRRLLLLSSTATPSLSLPTRYPSR